MRFVRTGRVPEEWSSYSATFAELGAINKAAATDSQKWPFLLGAAAEDGRAVEHALYAAALRQAEGAEGQLRLLVKWQDLPQLEAALSSMPAWKKERSGALRTALQESLQSLWVEGVQTVLNYGARPEDVDYLPLYDMLFDAQRRRYALFPQRQAEDMPSKIKGIVSASELRERRTMLMTSQSRGSLLTGQVVSAPKDHAYAKMADDTRLSTATSSEPARARRKAYPAEAYYPDEVWDLLAKVTPGITLYWIAKSEDTKKVHEGGVKARTLDLFIWAVLLGHTELASVLVTSCREPVRAALLGARISNFMADSLPLDAEELREAAAQHQAFAEGVLNMCPNFEAASIILATRSRIWHRCVIQLAVQSELKVFCANRYCQQLCDALYLGVQRDAYLDEPPPAHLRVTHPLATLPALLPLPLQLRKHFLQYNDSKAEIESRFTDIYFVPHIKQNIRILTYVWYLAFYSYTLVSVRMRASEHLEPGEDYRETTEVLEYGWKPLLLFVWTVSFLLDEWYKWASRPSTFELDEFKVIDYVNFSLTLLCYLARLNFVPISEEAGHITLSFAAVLGWIRLLKFLQINESIGVLVIIIHEMMSNIVLWLLVSSIFLIAFTVAFCSISHVPTSEMPYVWAMPMWSMLGAFDESEVATWNHEVGDVLLWFFVMVSNVLLVNLLIAMMGESYSEIKENSAREWKFGRLRTGIELVERFHPLPPPLNLPLMLVYFCQYLAGYRLEGTGADPTGSEPDSVDWDPGGRLWNLKRQKEVIAKEVLRERRSAQEAEQADSIPAQIQALGSRLERIEEALRDRGTGPAAAGAGVLVQPRWHGAPASPLKASLYSA
eukprot:Transcript_15726.p1 GENE.Transcript_15726~~Transcript_15726.p1  ORF type:complete len:838 (-),score=257.41 Transcript_15726:48-2561(-)